MNKKYIAYAILPVLALALVAGTVATASAHGFGWQGFNQLSPEDLANKQTTMFEHQAELLGVSVDVVKDAWSQGKSMKDLSEELGISQEDLQAKMQAEHQAQMQAQLQSLVDNGVITQDQANARQQFMQQRMDSGEGFGRHGGHRGMDKGGFGFGL